MDLDFHDHLTSRLKKGYQRLIGAGLAPVTVHPSVAMASRVRHLCASLCKQQLQLPHALVERLARLRQHRLQGEGAVNGCAVDQARAAAGSLKTIFQY